MTRRRVRPAVAVVLSLALAFSFSLSSLVAATPAKFSGRVVEADGVTPRPGVTIVLVGVDGPENYETVTNDEGTFVVADVATGRYTLLARTAGGSAFLAAESLELKPGNNPPLALTLHAPPADATVGAGLGQGARQGRMPVWAERVVFGLIGLGALFLIDDALENVEESSSPFNMGSTTSS